MKIGKTNYLEAKEKSEHGFYLTDESGEEVLLPTAYCPDSLRPGDQIEVFVYKDSSDRPVAVTGKPLAEAGEFAWMKVTDVNRFGAFVDWGLPKELLVPFAEQNEKLSEGRDCLIYVLRDEKTNRMIGSAKINRYLQFEDVDLKAGEEVQILLHKTGDKGISAVVNGKYSGLVFHSDIHRNVHPGDKLQAWVKQVRPDGKIDLSLEPLGYESSVETHLQNLLEALEAGQGYLPLNDKSSPAEISQNLGMSKKAFKKAVGKLLRDRRIVMEADGIRLL
ncbi:MAG: S1 RNA-binding domain-containing protein [Bacteroidales bacterium]